MKITAGLGSTEEYERFVQAGADEFFCGYVPYGWSEKYGTVMPLNRREVLSYNVQIGAFSELEILAAMVSEYGKPVHLTFNSLHYIPQQYLEIAEIIRKCMDIGFCSYIIADPALMLYLREQKIDCEIHLSGETAEVNHGMVDFFQKMRLKRVIFHRKNTIEDMRSVIAHQRAAEKERSKLVQDVMPEQDKMEFEAFVLNELCQFTGAFCNSLHCDEMGYLCRVPYHLRAVHEGKVQESTKFDREIPTETGLTEADLEKNIQNKTTLPENSQDIDGYFCGKTGCGLCALYQLKESGITHLKLVGRGNYTDFMEKDIRNLRKALDILEHSTSEKMFRQNLKRELFPYECSENCYYK
ncbi:peptidase U32 family protein [Blautia sp. MSJ-19]|uniref:peptidase U32 family protein n=1 Tax=Blautia sp. MSJ-19 TaxID=2841517 RepID=UPI001C0ECEDA|nr:U32 family peptidase [Blautia sp. MSJ-19]MBU5482614.1 U32 family peptidase [Blautia sp. MSJ-19]